MTSNKDLHIQFRKETGYRVPQSIQSVMGLHKCVSELEYINWLEEKILEEWNNRKK